jgi:hypothetical protein
MAGARGLTIGEAAACLAAEFPGVTVAVLRRLEAAGKFTAGRSASGYRRYAPADLDMIRLLLSSGFEPSDGAGLPGGAGSPEGAELPGAARSGRGARLGGADPADLSGAEFPLAHPAGGAPDAPRDAAPVPAGAARVAALAAQRPAGARTGARAARTATSRIPAARGAGAGRTQAPAIAALFDVAADPAQGAPAQVPAAPVSHAGRAARFADLAQREAPQAAEQTVPAARGASTSSARRADRRWPDVEFFTPDLGEVSLDRDQLAAAARTDRAWVDGLVEYGLLPGADSAGGADLLVARASAELAQFGVEPRHLRAVAASAARVAELISAATTAGPNRDPARRERAVLAAPGRGAEAAAAAVRLHAALVRAALLRG